MQIDEAQLDPALSVRTVPKRDQKAFLYAKMAVARGTPIVARTGLAVPRRYLRRQRPPSAPVAPGRSTSWVSVSTTPSASAMPLPRRSAPRSGIITSSKTDTRSYRITIKNLHERAIPISVIDQVPVSQNADIKIELLGKSAPTRRDMDDKRGLLAWDMELKPDEEKVVEFGYRVTWPAAKKITYGQGS